MSEVRIVIPGRPVPKGRPRVAQRGRKTFIYTPEETVEFEQRCALVAGLVVKAPITGPVEVEMTFYFDPQYKVWTKRGRRTLATLPDLDNCIKSLLDGLNKVAFVDDSQVKRIKNAEIIMDRNERTEVIIREVG